VCVAVALLSLAAPVLADSNPAGQNLSPRQIHDQMWNAKARAAADHRFSSQTIGTSTEVQENYDVRYYDLFIRVDDTAEIIYGSVTILADILDNNVSMLWVSLYTNMNVDSIMLNGSSMSFGRSSNMLGIALDRTYNSGESLSLSIYYNGHPVEGGLQAFSFSSFSGNKVISTLSEPYFSPTWWPCKDRNDDKADSMDIAIEVANEFYVGSNGTLDSVINTTAGTDTYYYSVRYPIVPYLVSLAISVYVVWTQEYVYNGDADTMPVVHATYPSWDGYSRSTWGVTPDAIGILADVFGPYPFPDEKYGHSNFNWGGAMEHQTMSSMSGLSSFGFSEPVVVHELAHQWVGDMITCESWHDIWLNEGWASYAEAIYYEALGGTSSYRSYMAGMEYAAGGTIYAQDTSVGGIFTSRVYDKGAWVCHMLRGILGDEAFFTAIDDYMTSEHQYGSATSVDFENVFELSSGQDLTWFFEDWLHGEYRPNYRQYIWSEPSAQGGYDTYFVIRQIQTTNPQVFRMPLAFDVLFYGGGRDTLEFFNDQREQIFHINLPDSALNFVIDPGYWVLKYNDYTRPWELFIVSPAGDLEEGMVLSPYFDTVQVRGGAGVVTAAIIDGELPPGVSIDDNGILSGLPEAAGYYTFTVEFTDDGSAWSDSETFSINMLEAVGMPGDVTGDEFVDISDILFVARYALLGGDAPAEPRLADVDNDCFIDISDVLVLARYSLLGGAAPVIGCKHW
jgi:hypothetical protein